MTEQAQTELDLSTLVNNPLRTTETYWPAVGSLERSVGAQAILLSREKTLEYTNWINEVETVKGGFLMLQQSPKWVREQVKKSPSDKPIEIPLTDYNQVVSYSGSEDVLASVSKGRRRAHASRAYNAMGALNYAEDHGLYLAPLVHSLIMESPDQRELEARGGFEAWAVNELLDVDLEIFSGKVAGRLKERLRLAAEEHHQPGRINLSSSALVEVGAYFADFDELTDVEIGGEIQPTVDVLQQLSQNALLLADLFTDKSQIGEYPYDLSINRFVADQIHARRQDIVFLKLYSDAKFGLIDFGEAEQTFRQAQLDYIDEFQAWMKQRPREEGIAFEWMMALILRHAIYKDGSFFDSYVRRSSSREDYPEDNLRGSADSPKQAHDVFMKVGRDRYLYQCKLKSGATYSTPPLTIIKAKKILGVTDSKTSMMDLFAETADEIRLAYLTDSLDVSERYDALETAALSSLQSAA